MEKEFEYLKLLDNSSLYNLFFESLDDVESQYVISEMANRKHPKTAELCLKIINAKMKFEKETHSLSETKRALNDLFLFDKNQATIFFKDHYKKLPLDAFGSFIENYTSVFYKDEAIDKELVKEIKNYLKTLSKDELKLINHEYIIFMNTFKNLK